ncbi:MAG: MATE family efflux transporter [Gemmatimonadota bacterium]|nr:MATE family efflux transporter [Gemmatimonadota bacterium]
MTTPTSEASEAPTTPTDVPSSGSIKEVWLLACPIILANISETLLGVIDTFMVAQLGKVEVAAVGLGSMMAWLFYLPFLGLAMGVNTFVSQSFGAKRYEECGRMTWQGMYVAVGSGIFITLCIFLAPWLFEIAKPSDRVQILGTQYMQLRMLDGLGLTIGMTVASFLRGIGDTKTPMKIGIVVNILNIVLNYGLIYGNFGLPRMEVQGSALGSAIAGLSGGAIYLALYFRSRYAPYGARHILLPTRRAVMRIIRIGVPIGVQRFLDIGSFVIFSALIGRLGDGQLAANQIAIQMMSISYMVGLGIGMASTVLVGQYIGAKKLDLAEKSTYSALKLAIACMVLVGLTFLLFPAQVIAFFNDDPDVIRYGRQGLIFAAFFQAFDALAVVLIGSLRGAGDTRWTMIAALIGAWVIFLPLTYYLAITVRLDFFGAWLAATVYICGLGIACYYRFRQGAWKQMTI